MEHYLKMRTRCIGDTSRLIHEFPSKYSRFITIFDSAVRVPSGYNCLSKTIT
jgi:hypothetical protein